MRIALAALGIAALAFATPAAADVPAAVVGSWSAADGQYVVVISRHGYGELVYADYDRCTKDCSAAGAPRTTVDFHLDSGSGNTASGVDGGGQAVTAKVIDQGLWLTLPGMPTFVFPAHNGR